MTQRNREEGAFLCLESSEKCVQTDGPSFHLNEKFYSACIPDFCVT